MRVTKSIRYAFLALTTLCISSASSAQNMQFTIDVNQSGCQINVLNDGTLGLSGDALQLSSKLSGSGGSAGAVRITSYANYFMSAIAPTSWTTSPIIGNGDTDFQALFSGTSVNRGRDFAERDGADDINTRGGSQPRVTDLTIHLIADSTAGAFPTGYYSAFVTILCE